MGIVCRIDLICILTLSNQSFYIINHIQYFQLSNYENSKTIISNPNVGFNVLCRKGADYRKSLL